MAKTPHVQLLRAVGVMLTCLHVWLSSDDISSHQKHGKNLGIYITDMLCCSCIQPSLRGEEHRLDLREWQKSSLRFLLLVTGIVTYPMAIRRWWQRWAMKWRKPWGWGWSKSRPLTLPWWGWNWTSIYKRKCRHVFFLTCRNSWNITLYLPISF